MKRRIGVMIFARKSVMLLVLLSLIYSCSNNDKGSYDEIKVVREFYNAMSEGNYQKVTELIYIAPSPIGTMFAIGDNEISIFQKRFPWTGKKIVRVVKLPTSTDKECRYELQIESNGNIQKDNLFLIKSNNKWMVALIQQLRSEGY